MIVLVLRNRFSQSIKKYKVDSGTEQNKSELEKYLDEDDEKDTLEFDILVWWKNNTNRYPILSSLARDVLAVPLSIVASESAFSTGGRVLDVYRSSLLPETVEALLCTQDWLQGVSILNELEDDVQALEISEASI